MKAMKRQRVLIVSLVLILLIVMLSACVPEPAYNYTTAQGFLCVDYMSTGFDVDEAVGYKTKTEKTEYFFARDIAEADRNAFINAQEKIFRHLIAKNFAEKDVFLTIYLLSDCQGFARIKAVQPKFHSMFLANINDTGTHMQVLLTLQAIYGEMTNYGLLYGLSNIIAKELNFTSEVLSEPVGSLKNFWETFENQPLADLTYPCFIEPYATETEIRIVKQTVNSLAKYIYNKDSGKALKQLLIKDFNEFEESFTEWKNSWLKSIGSDVVTSSRAIHITFAYGGPTYPLVFKTPRALYGITDDYTDDCYINDSGRPQPYDKDYMKSDYTTLISTLYLFESEMSSVAAKLEDQDYGNKQYYVVFKNNIGNPNYGGIYVFSTSHAYLKTVSAFLHEYIHHLCSTYSTAWTQEAIAYYYGNTSYFSKDLYYITFKDLYPDLVGLAACEIYLGREYEIDDLSVIMDIGILLSERHRKTFDGNDYLVCFTFGNYLASKYGESALIQLFTSHCNSPESITGKSWQELQAEWVDWLESEYGYLRDLVEMP